ncbi:MAG: 4-hydroxybutyryl-CoA dehydratase, partial [Nannocystaceae bacterium]|nr:4-hydroxybutyryl-CoA dehydratase [Nannocystaceae bacterium]
AANSHQILVLPGTAMRPGEEDFAIAAAMPVDTPGISMIVGRQPSDGRKGGPDAGNLRYAGQEVVVLFRDVFVPTERIFLDGDLPACATLLDAFAGFHRASYGGCKPGNLDVLIGATALVARENGVRKASHVRDKLVEMAHLAETIHGLGLAASYRSTQHPAGVWQVDKVLANVCKQNVTRLPYEVVRLAEDLAGGLMATMPSLSELAHPDYGEALTAIVGSPTRAKCLRLIEAMTYGPQSVPLRIECMHGAGSPQAQRIVIEREIDWEVRMNAARRLAGLPEV